MFFFVLAGLVGAASAYLAAPIPTTVVVDVSNGAALEHFWSKGVRRGASLIHRNDVTVILIIAIPASWSVWGCSPDGFHRSAAVTRPSPPGQTG